MGKFAVAVSTTLLFFLGSFAYAPSASAWTNSSNTGYYKGHTKNKNGNMSFGNHGKLDGKSGYKHDNRSSRYDSYGKYRSHIAKSFKKKHDNNNFGNRDNNLNSYGKHWKYDNVNGWFGGHGKWDGKRYAKHDNRDNNHKKHFKKSSYKKHDSNNFVKRDNNHNSYGNHRNDGNVNGSFGGHNKWDGKRYAKHDNRDNSHKKNFKKSSYKKHDNNFVKHDNRNNSHKKNFKKSYNHGKRDGNCLAKLDNSNGNNGKRYGKRQA